MNDAPESRPSTSLLRRVFKHISWIFLKNMTLMFPSLPGSLMQCLLISWIFCDPPGWGGATLEDVRIWTTLQKLTYLPQARNKYEFWFFKCLQLTTVLSCNKLLASWGGLTDRNICNIYGDRQFASYFHTPGGIFGTLVGFSNGKFGPRPMAIRKMPPGTILFFSGMVFSCYLWPHHIIQWNLSPEIISFNKG